MTNSYSIESDNLSGAWAQAFLHIMNGGVSTVCPMIVSFRVDETRPVEQVEIRQIVNGLLQERGKFTIETVANTIFPNSQWNPHKDRAELYKRFARIQQRLLKVPQNRNGTYFQRLVAYQVGDHTPPVNQLEHVITTYLSGNHRNSALQASIFDPTRDHTNQRMRGFPCMQHVQFVVDSNTNELTIVGLYATQYIFEKAYGNYLGLYRLGKFMAHEMKLTLARVTCFASKVKLGNVTKTKLRELELSIKTLI